MFNTIRGEPYVLFMFKLTLNFTDGSFSTLAITIQEIPKLDKAPRIMPDGKLR